MIRWSLVNETTMTIKAFWELFKYTYKVLFVNEHRFRWSAKSLLKMILESAIFPDLSSSAKKILNDTRIHTVIFGHTHVYEYRQWGNQKEYFNTGTWTELTSLDITSLGKITKLTFVLLEYIEQEARPRGRLKEWKGFHRIEEDVAVA